MFYLVLILLNLIMLLLVLILPLMKLFFLILNSKMILKGFSALLNKIKSFDAKNLIIGLESTSHYGENLINFLFIHDFKVALINPLQTSHLRKANIRDAKNDNLDSLNIAKSLVFTKLNFRF